MFTLQAIVDELTVFPALFLFFFLGPANSSDAA